MVTLQRGVSRIEVEMYIDGINVSRKSGEGIIEVLLGRVSWYLFELIQGAASQVARQT